MGSHYQFWNVSLPKSRRKMPAQKNFGTEWFESEIAQSGACGTRSDHLKVEQPSPLQLLHVSRQPHGPTGWLHAPA